MKLALQVGCGAFMFGAIVAAKAARLGAAEAGRALQRRISPPERQS